MLGIVDNESAEKSLLYIQNYGKGYARAIAAAYGLALSGVQRQLLRLERDGVLVSQLEGRTRLFMWNPRYPLRKELSAFLEKALTLVPRAESRTALRQRRRPRRTGKPA